MKSIFGTSLSFLPQLGPKPLFSHKPGAEWSKPFSVLESISQIKKPVQELIPELHSHKQQEGMKYSLLIVEGIHMMEQGKCAFPMEFCVKTVSSFLGYFSFYLGFLCNNSSVVRIIPLLACSIWRLGKN